MSRGQATFPVGLRVLAASCALLALSWYAPGASANPPTSKQDVQSAQRAYESARGRLQSIQQQVVAIQARLQVATSKVEAQQQLLEKITADLLETRKRIADAQARYDAILAQLPRADAVIMAAAVADYRPIERATKKMKKKELGNEMKLRLIENPDLLKAIVAARKPGTIVIGFKAETGDATAEASRMLRDKKLDLVVANDIAAPHSVFGSDDDQVAFVSADGVEQLPLLKKTEVARRLVSKLAERLAR